MYSKPNIAKGLKCHKNIYKTIIMFLHISNAIGLYYIEVVRLCLRNTDVFIRCNKHINS